MTHPELESAETIITRDRKEHPECKYSSSISLACGTVDDKHICETIRRVLRDCPNWWPEHIHEHIIRHDGETKVTGGPAVIHERIYKAEPSFKYPGIPRFRRTAAKKWFRQEHGAKESFLKALNANSSTAFNAMYGGNIRSHVANLPSQFSPTIARCLLLEYRGLCCMDS